MASSFFQFKEFKVHHDLCAMKVGADGVTIAAWVDVSSAKTVLDVGCGSGLIALMIAQRSHADIVAIDIDEQSVKQTQINISNSPWSDKIIAQHISLQNYAKESNMKFDVIVSNPPYFSNSLKANNEARTMARHNDSLPWLELIDSSKLLLNESGKLVLILPINEGKLLTDIAKEKGFYCSKQIEVKPLPDKEPKRMLLEFQLENTVCQEGELILEIERGQYSPEYTELVKDYYLKL